MNLSFSAEEEAFRDEVRAFLRDNLPARISTKVRNGQHLSKRDMEEWHAILTKPGWRANHSPKEWSGPGLIAAVTAMA